MGQPSDYTPELADVICARLAAGETLKAICDDKAMPARSSVYLWLVKHAEFKSKYDDARKIQWETWADEVKDIADTPQSGAVKIERDGKPVETKTGDMVEHRRLRIWSRQWLLARMDPNRFGDRVKQEHTGADGGPIKTETEITEVRRTVVDPKHPDGKGVPAADEPGSV